MNNQAFIDGQNLYRNTQANRWAIDLARFREYLLAKFHAIEAYYFIGSYDKKHKKVYRKLKEAGYELVFRPHMNGVISKKKGNVDTDVVFYMMRSLSERKGYNKVLLVSGDGDYFRTVDYLIARNRFLKLLAPSRRTLSSLYRGFSPDQLEYLDDEKLRTKIGKL